LRHSTLDGAAANKTLKGGSRHPAARPGIWPGTALRIRCRDLHPNQPNRLAAFLNSSGGAENRQVNDFDLLDGFLVGPRNFGPYTSDSRAELCGGRGAPDDGSGKWLCRRFIGLGFGRAAGVTILSERAARKSSQGDKRQKRHFEPVFWQAGAHLALPPVLLTEQTRIISILLSWAYPGD
jgi:hypothetical protein